MGAEPPAWLYLLLLPLFAVALFALNRRGR